MQYEEDLLRPPHERQWLHHEVDTEGKQPFFVLANRSMLQDAVRRGHDEPIYMDATHGMQRYGLKVVTVHVRDVEGRGVACDGGERCCAVITLTLRSAHCYSACARRPRL